MSDDNKDGGARQADHGSDNMKVAVSGEISLNEVTDEQLSYFGGERDPIDSEDFTDADLGNDPDAKPPEDKDDDADGDGDKDGSDDDGSGDGDSAGEGDADGDSAGEGDGDGDGDSADADADGDGDGDGDGDADADGDADEDGDAEDPDKRKPKPKPVKQTIPKDRFDEVNVRRKAAEDELRDLKAEIAAGKDGEAEEFDFDTAEEKYMDAVLDGKKDEAKVIRKEIRAAERAEIAASTQVTSRRSATDVAEDRSIQIIAKEYEGNYDVLNPAKEEDYSEDILEDFAAQYTGYVSRGFTRPEATKLALDNVVRIYDLKSNEAGGTTDEGEADETTKAEKKAAAEAKKKAAVAKKKAAIEKKLKAAKGAPPDTGKDGAAGDSDGDTNLDISTMSDAEIDALPPSTLARMRGDLV